MVRFHSTPAFLRRLAYSLALAVAACSIPSTAAGSSPQSVHLDAPAFVEGQPVCDPDRALDPSVERLVEVHVEIAAGVRLEHDDALATLIVQALPLDDTVVLHDFSPRNVQDSPIEGLVQVESVREKSGSLGWNSRIPLPPADAQLQAGLNGKNGETLRYQRQPEQQLVVSSGFFGRRSGVYFKFHRSPQFPLEGTHRITLLWRVPVDWRTSLLQLQATALGPSDAMWGESKAKVAAQSTFLIPVFVAGDHEARALATAYRASEQRFRQAVAAALRRQQADDRAHPFRGLFGQESRPELRAESVEQLLMARDPAIADRQVLPREVSVALKELQRRKQQFVHLASQVEQPIASR